MISVTSERSTTVLPFLLIDRLNKLITEGREYGQQSLKPTALQRTYEYFFGHFLSMNRSTMTAAIT
jgi:hypothetical protein